MKNTKKLISVLLTAMLLVSMTATSAVSVSAVSGELASVYKTNPTQPTESSTEPPSADLTVNASSNYFNSQTMSGLEIGDTFTVNYELNSNFNVRSADWQLSYDSSKLRLKTSGTDLCPIGGGTVNDSGNPVFGNFTDALDGFSFSGGKSFVQAEFEVIGTGTANVQLTVDELNVGYVSGGTLYLASPVENGQTVNIKNQPGFSGANLSTSTEIDPIVIDTLTVNAQSNFFKSASATFNEDTNQVTVTYQLQSNMKLVNAQWSLRYDTSKLSYVSASMPAVPDATIMTPQTGAVTGNFTDLSMVDFSAMSDFATFVFDVHGTGETTVTLTVVNLAVGYKSGSQVNEGYLVDYTEVKNLKTQSGFTNLNYSTNTIINDGGAFLRGDVDLDGEVTINDATLLQRYLAEYTTLNATQLRAADTNVDGKVNIRDVSNLQRALAFYIILQA